ncbi:unnamed protein product [Caenorhabditis brenneri]
MIKKSQIPHGLKNQKGIFPVLLYNCFLFRTPFGLVTKHLTSAVKLLKQTDKVSKWQDTIERIAEKANEIKELKKMGDFMQKRLSVFTDAAEKMKQNKKMAKDDSLKELNDLEELIDNDQIKEVLRNRKEQMTEQEKLLMVPMKMIRDGE